MFRQNPYFLGKKPFVLLFVFLFVDLEFSFLPLKYFIYFKRRSFRSGIVAIVYADEKAHFPSFTNSSDRKKMNPTHLVLIGQMRNQA